MRVLAGFLIAAPVSVFGYVFAVVSIIYATAPNVSFSNLLEVGVILIIYGIPLAYLFSFVFGIPSFFVLKYFRLLNVFSTISVAALIGSFFIILPEAYSLLRTDSGVTFSSTSFGCRVIVENGRTGCGYVVLAGYALMYAAVGALAGLVFWTIYRPRSRR